MIKLPYNLTSSGLETSHIASMGRSISNAEANNLFKTALDLNVKTIDTSNSYGLGPLAHHIVTTRISEDPNKGAVEINCKVHDIDNLFIAGSSFFPARSHANPTLMIVLMSSRLAEHLKTNF